MELQHVQPGEKITAQGYNDLVDACGGAGNSSSEGFMNTGSGTVLWPRAQINAKYYNGAWRTMFQVISARYWKQTTRGQWDIPNMQQTLLIDLGADAASLKSNISVRGSAIEDAALVVGESSSMDAKVDDDLYENAAQKKASWVDLGIKASDTNFIDGDVLMWKPAEQEGEKAEPPSYYFIITDKSFDDAKDRAQSILGISGDGELTCLQTIKLMSKGSTALDEDLRIPIQGHTGAIMWSDLTSTDILSTDSEVEAAMLSSIQKISAEVSSQVSSETSGGVEVSSVTRIFDLYSLYNFYNPKFEDYDDVIKKENDSHKGKSEGGQAQSPKRADVLIRYGKETDETSADSVLEYVALSSFQISCDTYFEEESTPTKSLDLATSEKGIPMLEIKGFKDEERAEELPEKFDLIVRAEIEGDKTTKEIKYISPTDMVQVDHDISSLNQSSLEKKTDPEDDKKKYIQLYNFDNPGNTVLSIDKYTHQLPDGYKLVVRHSKDAEEDEVDEVDYCDLSIDVQNMSADTEINDKTKSIDADRTDNYFKLHNFDGAGTNATFTPSEENSYKAPDDGKELLYRDGDELKYCNIDFNTLKDDTLSAAQKLYKADSEFPNEQLSSLEKRENTEDDPDDPDKKLKRQEFSMYRFNQQDYRHSRSEVMDDSTVLVREINTGGQKILRYVDLSCFEKTISGDVDIDQSGQEQKSVEFKETSDNDKKKYVQLYNFDNTTADVKIDLKKQDESDDKYQFLVKKVSDGKLNELQYAEVSAVLSAEVDDKSIEVNEDTGVLQLKYFPDGSYQNITLSAGQWFDLSGKQCLVGKNLETGEVNYYNFKVDLSANQVTVDTEVSQDGNYATQSIDEDCSSQDEATFHRLHNFDQDSALNKEDWEDTMHVLIRKKEDSNLELDYIKLSDLSGAQVSCDTDGTTGKKSIDHNSKDELQIYNFENGIQDLTGSFQEDGTLPDGFDVLVRSDGEIRYANLSVDMSGLSALSAELSTIENNISALSADAKTDSEVPVNLSSIERYEYTEDGETHKAYSLFDFHKDDKVGLEDLNKTTDALLVRTGTGQKVLKYLDLSCLSATDVSVDNESIEFNEDTGVLQFKHWKDDSYTNVTLSNGQWFDEVSRERTKRCLVGKNLETGEIEYYSFNVDISAAQVSVDSEGTTGKNSIDRNDYGQIQLYNFDNATSELTVGFDSDGRTPTTQLFPVRNSNGQLMYSRLQYIPRTDTSWDDYSTSIEYNTSHNSLMINGFRTKANMTAAQVSADVANCDVLMRRHNGSHYYTEYMNVAPLLSGGGGSGLTKDLSVVTNVVWDTSNYQIKTRGVKMTFVNGLLSAVSDESDMSYIATTPWTGE